MVGIIGRVWNIRHDIIARVGRVWNIRHDILEFIQKKTKTFFRILPQRKTYVELSKKQTTIRKLVK
jgi:hypothetical protein